MRTFVILGTKALASDAFLLDDLPGTSGRLDVLVRSVRAALLTSHGVRRDATVYLVLLGGERAPRTVRLAGEAAKFLRPDERSLAVLLKKALASHDDDGAEGFVERRHGLAVGRGGLSLALDDAAARAGTGTGPEALFLLDEQGDDVRGDAAFARAARSAHPTLVLGDHEGPDDAARTLLLARGARLLRVGPTSLHTEDAVAVVTNELDRAAPPAAALVSSA